MMNSLFQSQTAPSTFRTRLCLAYLVMATSLGIPQSSGASDSVFLGYYFTGAARSMPPATIPFEYYTHICHAFLLGKGDGSVETNHSMPSRELTSAAHAKNVRVILSLGGWGSDDYFREMCGHPEAIARHVREVIHIVDEYDYDGIDLDWEFPDTPEEKAGFHVLTMQFRETLNQLGKKNNRSYELTMAVTAGEHTGKWLDTGLLLGNMDFLNIMTYDFTGPWSNYAAHHSPLFETPKDTRDGAHSIIQGMTYWAEQRNVPKDRLVVGLALYGRGFECSEPYSVLTQNNEFKYTALPYNQILPLIKQGWKRTWDRDIRSPFITSPDKDVVIGYDDAKSITAKTLWARHEKYRGIFFWAVPHDRMEDGTYPLQAAAAKAWPKSNP